MARPIKHTVETLTKILDSQCSHPSVAVACARAGISQASFWSYRLLSENDAPEFVLEFLGVQAQFASHLVVARSIYMSKIEAKALERAERGTVERVFYQGRPSWVMDHRYEGWSDEDLRDLGLSNEDRYEHDPVTGERVQHVIEHAPSTELLRAALAAYSKRWAAQSRVEINQQVALGVSAVGDTKPKALVDVTPKPQIEHVGKPTAVEGVFEEIVVPVEQPVETENGNDLRNTWPPAAVEVGVETRAPPVAPHDDPNNPITRAVRAQEAARAANVAAAGKPPLQAPLPLPVEMRADPDADLDDVTGQRMHAQAPPTMDAIAERLHDIKMKIRDNVALSAIERQVANALRRGDDQGARILLGYRQPSEREGLGEGTAAPGGMRTA